MRKNRLKNLVLGKQRHNYSNLNIWPMGSEISLDIPDLLETSPKHEVYILPSQISRCSISMLGNILEGSGKSYNFFSNYFDIARESPSKLDTQLIIAKKIIANQINWKI